DDGEDGEPAAEFAFTEKGEGLAYAVDFAAEAEHRGIQIAEKAIQQGRLELKKSLDAVEVQIGGGDGVEQLELDELVAGNVARFDHGRPAKEVALKIGEAEPSGFIKVALGFDFLGEEGEIRAAVFGGEGFARIRIEQLEIDFEEGSQLDEGTGVRGVHKIVEGEEVTGIAQLAADGQNFVSGLYGLQDFHNNAILGKQTGSAKAQGQLVHIDEGAGVAGQKLEIEQGDGIGDDTRGSVGIGLKGILRAAAEEQFVGKNAQTQIKDGLAGYEFFVHKSTPSIVHGTGAGAKVKPAWGECRGSRDSVWRRCMQA